VRPCPFCAEQIQPGAILCRWCGMRIVPTRTPAAANGAKPWARTGLILGGILIGLSPVLPWISVVLLGNLSLVELSQAGVSPIPLIALVVLGIAGFAGGLLAQSTWAARTTAVILGAASAILTGTLLVQLLRLTSEGQPLASTAAGPWIAILGSGATLLGAAIPAAQPSGPPTGQVAPSGNTVTASAVGVVVVAGVIAAIIGGGPLHTPKPSSSPASQPTPRLTHAAAPATPSAPVLPDYPQPDSTSPTPETTDSADLTRAEAIVTAHGYTPDENSQWPRLDGLNVITATATGSADGYDRRAFFFYGNNYLGTDATQSSADVGESWSTSDTVALSYRLYKPSDPACCPTAGSALVRFHWDGSRLRPLDAIPAADGNAVTSRR
jgi:hypothetical protein